MVQPLKLSAPSFYRFMIKILAFKATKRNHGHPEIQETLPTGAEDIVKMSSAYSIRQNQPVVVGLISDLTSSTRFAGKPPRRACSITVAASGAM
jgi:hypothetical protein